MGSKGVFDLETHFAFYGAYHSNPVNVLIHTIFVWPIFFTSLVLLYFTPSPFRLLGFEPPFTLPSHVLFFNFGFFFALLYAGFYVLMDRKAGSLAAFLCMGCWVGSCYLANHLGSSLASKVDFFLYVGLISRLTYGFCLVMLSLLQSGSSPDLILADFERLL
ncbi:hypothetical protein MLD38_031912 [Melastoma candidum]|uniref:Uncharacterized protein n=1 Tax=Melastoma candidum TaxID=119954 RepID=A0ACB9MQR6_9MYRT|nr:hypothetical protein MLD38_031912 [Melastoma candidum]